MEMKEFLVLINQLNAAYRGRFILTEEMEIRVYYDALNELGFEKLKAAMEECILNEVFYPSVATIKSYAKEKYCDWSEQWLGYIGNVALHKLNEGSQYAIKLLTKEYIDRMIFDEKTGYVMKEFRELYNKFYLENRGKKMRKKGIDEKYFLFKDPEEVRRLEIEQRELREKEMQEEEVKRLLEKYPHATLLPDGSVDPMSIRIDWNEVEKSIKPEINYYSDVECDLPFE